MTPPPKTRISKDENVEVVETAERLARIETQLTYLNTSWTTISKQITDSETERNKQWLEYTKSHSEVVNTSTGNTQKIASLESTVNNLAMTVSDLKDLHEEDVNDINNKIDPLLTMHKVLIGVSIFFASSMGALIWAILTHTIVLTYK